MILTMGLIWGDTPLDQFRIGWPCVEVLSLLEQGILEPIVNPNVSSQEARWLCMPLH